MCRRPLCSGGCVATPPKQRNKVTSSCAAGFVGLLRFLGNPCSSTVQWPMGAIAQLRGHLVQLCNFIATAFLSLAAHEKCKARQHARSEHATELVQIEPRAPPKQAGSTKHCFKGTWCALTQCASTNLTENACHLQCTPQTRGHAHH